jgi:hypothetical protein
MKGLRRLFRGIYHAALSFEYTHQFSCMSAAVGIYLAKHLSVELVEITGHENLCDLASVPECW